MGEVAITKASAATRLLDAAILMFFRGDDELATHLTASASSRLLTDLYESAGGDLHVDRIAGGFHQLGLDFIAGTLPEFATTDPIALEIAEQIAIGIRSGAINCPEDLNLELSKSHRRELIRLQNKNYNFLKHADMDPLAVLDESELDNIGAIQAAMATYSELFPGQVTSPMIAFLVYRARELGGEIGGEMKEMLAMVEGMGEQEARAMLAAFCADQS